MHQDLHQVEQQATSRNPGWFRPGQSGNPSGMAGRSTKAQRAEKARALLLKLAKPFGGLMKLSDLERIRLEQAAALLMRKPPNAGEHVRLVNAADRLIGSVERSRLAGVPQRRQSTKAHMAPSELPRSLAKLVKPKP
jgi:hypothetical protein